MRKSQAACGLFVLGLFITFAENWVKAQPMESSLTDQKQEAVITERGAHHKIWERVEYEQRPDGTTTQRRQVHTELATGLHFKNELGEWEESKEEIEILPNDAGAIARKGQHKVLFPPEIKSGLIELQTPDQKWLRSRVWGLAYFDTATGESVLLAEVQESEGKVVGDNVVVYPNAFTDFVADLRYTYTKAGFEQDVILRENPPTPEEFGLHSETVRLQVLTEFFEPEQPQKAKTEADGIVDETLDFAGLTIGAGKAFSVDGGSKPEEHVSVAKQWGQIEGRDFLVEEVRYGRVVEQLRRLPAAKKYKGASLLRRGEGESVLVALKQMMPKSFAQESATRRSPAKRMARAKLDESPGFVMDYVALVSQSNYTFKGGETYYVNGAVNLSGTTTIEGGAVVKFASGTGITINGPIICLTEAYRPVVLTGKDDNSVGQAISGSTGNPSGYYAATALNFNSPTAAINLHDFRISYASLAISIGGSSASLTHTIRHAQFQNVGNAVYGAYNNGAIIAVHNAILSKVASAAFSSLSSFSATSFSVQNCTLDRVANVFSGSFPIVYAKSVMNSLLVSVTNNTVDFIGQNNATNSSSAAVFEASGGGAYYLVADSPYRNRGAGSIDSTLLASLRKKTTYPPISYTNTTFPATVTLAPQAQRDTDAVDLGYHYDPLDYIGRFQGGNNAQLILTNGVALGIISNGINGFSAVISEGKPQALNYIVQSSSVQEGAPITHYNSLLSSWGLKLRFTHLSSLGNVPTVTMGAKVGNVIRDCLWSAVTLSLSDWVNVVNWEVVNCDDYERVYIEVKNNVFERCNLLMESGIIFYDTEDNDWFARPLAARLYNNLFWRCDVTVNGDYYPCSIYDYDFGFYNNVFQDTTASFNGSWMDYGGNADVGTSSTGASVIYASTFSYSTGPLGRWYQASTDLIDQGDWTADTLGFYHYTTQFNQTKEALSQVDIGYHYVAVDNYGKPVDTDSDGVSDYSEDANGDGNATGDTTSWQSYNSPNGLSAGNGLQVFTPLK